MFPPVKHNGYNCFDNRAFFSFGGQQFTFCVINRLMKVGNGTLTLLGRTNIFMAK